MKNPLLCLSAAALVAAGFVPDALAQNSSGRSMSDRITPLSGVYVGAFGGYGWTDADTSAGTLDVNGGDYGVFAGYQLDAILDSTLNRSFGMGINGALEVHYALSDADDSQSVGGTTVDTEKNHEFGISFRPGLSFVDRYAPFGVKPYGIIGYRRAEFQSSAAGVSEEENYNGFELGIGTELIAYEDFGIRLDYSHVFYDEENGIDADEDDLRLGLAYHF